MKFDLKDYAEYIPQKEHAAPAGYNHQARVFVEVIGAPQWNKSLSYLVPKEALEDPREAKVREIVSEVMQTAGLFNTAERILKRTEMPEITAKIKELAGGLKG